MTGLARQQTGMERAGRLCAGARVQRARAVAALVVPLLLVLGMPAAVPAQATTLREAMAQAYRANPKLDAERARLRATDEEVPRALSGARPELTGSADAGYLSQRSKPLTTTSGNTDPWGYSLTLSQSIFSGFKTVNAVNEAEANVRAGRENLRLIEQQTLLSAVTAYADVQRDAAIVELRRNHVDVLTRELTAARARRRVREITRTDVAQAEARRARGLSALDLAIANHRASKAAYLQVIGVPAKHLARATVPSRLLPKSLKSALHLGENESPNVVSAKYREQAARFAVDKIRGELYPEVRLEASYGKRYDSSISIQEETDARFTGRVTVPFYRGGEVHARVRQAKHIHVSRLQEIEQSRQETAASVTAAWVRLQAAKARLSSDHVQVAAARTALEGVREEEKVGERTILDVLNAEQELLDAEVALAATRRDLLVASYTAIASTGRLNAQELALMSEVYDPNEHYHEVHDKWAGISITSGEAVRPDPWEGAEEMDGPVTGSLPRETATAAREAGKDVAPPSAPEPGPRRRLLVLEPVPAKRPAANALQQRRPSKIPKPPRSRAAGKASGSGTPTRLITTARPVKMRPKIAAAPRRQGTGAPVAGLRGRLAGDAASRLDYRGAEIAVGADGGGGAIIRGRRLD